MQITHFINNDLFREFSNHAKETCIMSISMKWVVMASEKNEPSILTKIKYIFIN
jgi:hypothetical protein